MIISEFNAGLSSPPCGLSSDETERGEGLREEEEDDKGCGEPSDELQLCLENTRAGDCEQQMTDGRSMSSPCGLVGRLRLAWAIRFFFSRGEMTSAAAAGGAAGGAAGRGAGCGELWTGRMA